MSPDEVAAEEVAACKRGIAARHHAVRHRPAVPLLEVVKRYDRQGRLLDCQQIETTSECVDAEFHIVKPSKELVIALKLKTIRSRVVSHGQPLLRKSDRELDLDRFRRKANVL